MNKIHLKHCSAFCWLFAHYVFIHLLEPFELSSPSVWLLCIVSIMNAFDISMQNIASVLISQLTSTGYKTALQKALTSPCTEYENCGNFCNSNYVYNRVIILPENYGFPLPIGSFIVLTLVNNLVEYLTRPTNRGVGSTSAKVPVRRY